MAGKNKAATAATSVSTALVVAPVQPPTFLAEPGEIPKNLKRLNLPRLLKAGEVPVNASFAAKLVKVIDNFTGKKELEGSKCLHLQHAGGEEFLFPCTGVIRRALDPKPEAFEGKTLWFKRLSDGTSAKYKKAMFVFDVFVEE